MRHFTTTHHHCNSTCRSQRVLSAEDASEWHIEPERDGCCSWLCACSVRALPTFGCCCRVGGESAHIELPYISAAYHAILTTSGSLPPHLSDLFETPIPARLRFTRAQTSQPHSHYFASNHCSRIIVALLVSLTHTVSSSLPPASTMIRSVSRAAARLASKPATATRTTVLRTLVATPTTTITASFSSLTSTSSTSPSTSAAPTNLRTLKRDISRIIDEDTADLAAAPDQGLLDYVKEQSLRITQDKEGLIKLARTVGDYNIVIQFMPDVDEDEMGGADGEEGKADGGEDGEEGKAEGEDDEEVRLPSHQWEVDITNTVAPQHNTVRLACLTSKQGQYSIEAISFDPQPTTSASQQQQQAGLDMSGIDERKQLYFDELSEATQDKMFELLESLGVDDKLGQFVQHYAQVVRTQQYLDKLKMLKQFLQQ